MATTEQGRTLAHARRLLIDERYGDAVHALDGFLKEDPGARDRLEALILRLVGLIRVGRTAELTTALDEAFEAGRSVRDLSAAGALNALAALVAHRLGSLDRCATHLVRGARELASIELTNVSTAWAWHDLAVAYSATGFHGQALAAIDRARQVAANVGLPAAEFAAPAIRLRLATSLDHRGDSDGCRRVLRDILADLDHRSRSGELNAVRPSSLGAYGYALARLAAFGDRAGVIDAEHLGDARSMLVQSGATGHNADLRALGLVCLAIAEHRPVEAVARLESITLTSGTFDDAETYRLRALAHLAADDHASAHRADRHAFRVASSQFERVRELFIEAVAARLDSEELRRSVAAGYPDGQRADPLTGLPDRERLEQHIADLLGKGEQVLVGICDLDDFTIVNGEHGRSSGDLVLQRIAGVLNRVMRRGDLVARAGGDEFAVVLPPAARPEIREISRRILTAIGEEDWAGLVPGARIGVTLGWAGATGDEVFDTADQALAAAMTDVERNRSARN